MKKLLSLLLLLTFPFLSVAQEEEMTFVPFENVLFGLEGVVPDGWTSGGPGVYLRSTGSDLARIIIQAAPLAPDQLLTSLLQRMPVEGTPEVTGEITTEYFSWQERTFSIETQGLNVALTVALAEQEGVTALILLQSAPEEHDALREQVYLPVLQSVRLLQEEVAEELPYLSEDVTFASGEIELAGTLTIPQGEGTFPAVVLISGSGPSNRDESIAPLAEIAPFRILADHLTRNGIAVLRYDDRGVGESGGDYASTTLVDFAADTRAALDYLATRSEINPDQRGILGHSEGGAIAALTASGNPDVAFVVSMAGAGVPLSDVLVVQVQRTYQAMGLSQEQIDFIMEAYMPMMDAMFAADADLLNTTLRELTVRQINTLAPAQMPDDATLDMMIEQSLAAYLSEPWLFALSYDPAEDLGQITAPVLAVFGTLDTQVDAEQNATALEAALAENPDVTIVTIEGANHLFQQAVTGGVDEYPTLEQTLMPEFLNTVTDWILERFGQ